MAGDGGTAAQEMSENRQWLRMRACELLFDVGYFPFFAHMVLAGLVVWVLWPDSDHATLVAWFAVLVAGIAVQMLFLRSMRPGAMTVEKSDRIHRFFDGFGVFVGVSWAALIVLVFPQDNYFNAVFLAFAAGGLAMGGVATQHMVPVGIVISIVVALGTLAARYAVSDIPNPYVHAIGLALYTAVLVDLTLRLNKSALRAAQLQFQQEKLTEALSRQADELSEARRHEEEARREAEVANDAKSRFLAQASHDLRQPLHAISLFVEALPKTRNTMEREDIMGRVRQSLDVLTRLFDSLLDVTLLDTGGIEVRETAFRPGDLIEEVTHDFALIAEACNVELRTVPSSAAIRGDPVLLRRLLQNLISNAIRYSEGGSVLIGCRRRQGRLAIQVSDTGAGIAQEDQARIFSEFERLDSARIGEKATPGLGLGLAIVQRIARELELSVDVTSRQGRGSTFTISGFDMVSPAEVVAVKQPSTEDRIAEGANVFVLDDDPETLAATRLLLEKWGYRADGSQNWQDLMRARPDVVVCDFEISPEKTGFDVLADYAAVSGNEVSAIMVSGHGSDDLREAAKRRDLPLLMKPVRPVQLRSALLNVLSGRQTKPREAANEATADRLGRSSARSTADT